MTTLLILRGLPASGKSTFAKEWVAEYPDNRMRVNRDNLRWTLGIKEGVGTFEQEQEVTHWQNAMIDRGLSLNKDVVVDNTNLRAKFVKELMKRAYKLGADVEFRDFPVTVDEAIARDDRRGAMGERSVGSTVISSMASKFLVKGQLPPVPTVEPLGMVAYKPYVPVKGAERAVLVDIDGTLAHMNGRSPYDATRYHEDTFDEVIADIANAWYFFREETTGENSYLIVMSGRDSKYRAETEAWLTKHRFGFDELYMRPEGDTRNDAIVKDELFEKYIAGNYNIDFVLDDRNRVVDMWRAKGLKVLQVADGNF